MKPAIQTPQTDSISVAANFPPKLKPLFQPSRFKVLHGGRGGAKSWSIARALLLLGQQQEHRILCCREFMQSLQDSVWRLLCDQVYELGLQDFYELNKGFIKGRNGTEFRFAGIRSNVSQVKSFEGITIAWCEEASNISKYSWDTLIPTIRRPGSEIWISMNPELETDDSYKRWILNPPSDAVVINVNWRDNPWLPEVLMKEMLDCKARAFDDYMHIWEGQPRRFTEGAVYVKELQQAEQEGRITRVPYEPRVGVQAFVDCGYADATAIWLCQKVGFELHLIDYIEASRKPWDYYLKVLSDRPYPIQSISLPFDAKAKQLGTGRSIEEMTRSHGYKTLITPNLSISDGIAAARSVFPAVYFDKVNTEAGLNALRHYRYELEIESKGGLKQVPRHDFSSHGADSFRYLALGQRSPKQRPDSSKYREPTHIHMGASDSWMSM